jgi:hypothetical protein
MPSSASKKSFRAGQAVEWDSSQGVVEGKVERTVTKPTKVKGHTAKASPDHPEVLVKSDRTGAEAVHRPEELRAGGSGKGRRAAGKTTPKRKTAPKKSSAKTPSARKKAAR